MKETTEISFYRYAAIVKNLRGVLYWKDEGCNEEKLKWLLSRFRYRDVGISPSAKDRFPRKRNLVILSYPNRVIFEVKKLISTVVGDDISEVLCLSSTYISPIITNCSDCFRNIIVDEVKTAKELEDKDWKLHFRIADYTILDLYSWATAGAMDALKNKRVEEHIEERKKRVKEDKKRYWRLMENRGRTVIAYVDLFQLIYRYGLLDDFAKLGDDAFATMGIIPIVCVD